MSRMLEYIDIFKKEFPEPLSPTHKKLNIAGMGTGATGKMINIAIGLLKPDECYLEVGTWRGSAVLNGLSGHKGKHAIVVDNFEEFEGSEEIFRDNVKKFNGRNNRISLYPMDWKEFLEKHGDTLPPIGAYFYDGLHSFEQQIEGICRIEPYLADDAIVFIDDTNALTVRESLGVIERLPGFKKIIDIPTPRNSHPTYWNGFSVFQYRKFAPSVVEWNREMYNHPKAQDGKYIKTKMGKIKSKDGAKIKYWA